MPSDLNRLFKDRYIQLLSPSITPEQKEKLQKACLEQSPQLTNQEMQLDKESTCFRGFYVLPDSKTRRNFEVMQFLNLSYISHAVPLYVAFNVEIVGGFMFLEAISTLCSVLNILINLRTPVTLKGQQTLQFQSVIRHYWQHGMFWDLFGILPFNLIFYKTIEQSGELDWGALTVVIVLRLLRVLNVWQ